MSAETVSPRISTPVYYHREYENDLPKEEQENSLLDQCKRVSTVALPFISLYKPLSFPLSLTLGGVRVISTFSQLLSEIQNGNVKDALYAVLLKKSPMEEPLEMQKTNVFAFCSTKVS